MARRLAAILALDVVGYTSRMAEDPDATLKDLGVKELLITGLQTEYCVDTACRAALSHGYDVVLVEDGHSTGDADLPAEEIVRHHNALLANTQLQCALRLQLHTEGATKEDGFSRSATKTQWSRRGSSMHC